VRAGRVSGHHGGSCTDATQLDLWFDRAITAGTAAEVFAD